MPAFAEMLVSQSPPVYSHTLSTADYNKPGSPDGSPGSPIGGSGHGTDTTDNAGRPYFTGMGNYCRPASLALSTSTNGAPPPFQRQLTPPWGLSPTNLGPRGGPASPRRSCLVVRPDEAPSSPEEPERPLATDMIATVAAAAAEKQTTAEAAVTAAATAVAVAATAAAEAIRSKKKVVFADDHGGQLTQVRVMREPSYMPPIWSLQFLAHVTQGMISPVPQEQWVVDFVQPASDYVRFRQKLDERNVSLENVIIKETEQLIVGTVKVKNLSYHKEVIIRSSCDGWKTHEDTFCTYSVVGNGAASAYLIFDTFSFKLTLPPKSRRIEFCAAFKCDGVEYWDNNDGRNYSLTNRIAPREDSGAFLSTSSAAFGSQQQSTGSPASNGRNGSTGGFSSPYVDPGALLDTWSDMSVESQSGPYCSPIDFSLERCTASWDEMEPPPPPALAAAVAGSPQTRQQMKPIGMNLGTNADLVLVRTSPTYRAASARRASVTEGESVMVGHRVTPPGMMRPIGGPALGRSASSSKLFYVRERHEGEDLLANLLRLRKLMQQ